jgi:PAS domain S-box-containing protein
MELRIVEVGLNFYKSIPNIINGNSLFEYFLLDRMDSINHDKVNDQWFNMMHFLDLKHESQRYKCSIRKLNGLYYLWASPVINTKFALKNYHVTVNDFPNHDTIAEYLFLEQTSRRSLEESREITNNLLAKNKEVSRIQKEMKAIAKFPGENPNPILRFDLDLNLVYHNPSAEKSFLSDFGIDDGKINNEEVRKVILKIIKDNEPYKQLFIEGDKHYYSINTALIADMGYLNIYAHDITEYQYRSKENESALRQLNEKIESQREFYEFILNNLPADVAVFNKDHQYVFINPKGIEDDKVRAYMIGKDDYDYCKLKGISSDMADGRRALFKRILESKENETWVDDLIDRHGNRNVIHRSMGPLFDENGEIRMVIGYGTEITQRVIAEEENVKLSLVAKNTNNGVLMLNREMRITWANQAMIDRSGYSLKEMLGKNPREFISSNERSPEMSQIQEAAAEKKNIEVEVMQRSKEGTSYYVALNFQPLYDAENNHSGYMMVEFDITDRIRNESTIRNLNVNLERLVQEKTAKNMELASSLRDQEKMVTIGELASGVAHDLNTPLGAIKSGTDNVSYTLDVLFKKVLPQCTSDEIQYAFSRTMATTFELFVGGVQMKREKDQFLTLISTLSASVKESELDEIAMLLVKNRLDISDEEEVLFILNSRNPLLLLNLMYHVHLVFSFIKTIANSGSRASQVVQNLRLFIREKRNTESGTVNIKNNIETVLNIFSHKIQNQVDLTLDIDDNLHIKGFDVRLFQLWSNLIKNSLECMEDQKEKVLKLYSEVSPSVFTIIVENNGPEIKGELKRKIFNKFFTTKGSRNGSGMGLSIVKNVLEEHQGRIDVKSDEKATRFVIQFNRF